MWCRSAFCCTAGLKVVSSPVGVGDGREQMRPCENERRAQDKKVEYWRRSGRKVQMYYSVWLQLQLDVTEFTKEEGETTAVM